MDSSWKVIITAVLAIAADVRSDSNAPTDGRQFPKGFKFGVATASYQVEGAWNQTGKGWSIWDTMTHMSPNAILEKHNGDIACDSFHKYKEDVQNAKSLGVDVYRFSISWPRIMPKGLTDEINQAGVDYYHNLIDELLANGVEPMVTMFHWDMPEHIQSMGGFLYDGFDSIFASYAEFLYKTYGHKVKWWTTFNEPPSIVKGYSSMDKAPRLNLSEAGGYAAGHNLLKAHAKAYHLYNDSYAFQGGKVSTNIVGSACIPKTNSEEDKAAAERCWEFGYGFFLHPIYSKTGDYSDIVKKQVAKWSKKQGVPNKLPTFTKEEVEYVRGTYDYMAINLYTANLVSNDPNSGDEEFSGTHDPSWPYSASSWLFTAPETVGYLLNWLKTNYDNPPVFITEFGFSDSGTLGDDGRINYYSLYFDQLKKTILDDGCNVIGATAWSLMDNFEWMRGYTEKFGFIHVDFNDPERTRTWKKSAHWYKNFIKANKE